MPELTKEIADLIRGTAIENDEHELAQLRRLPLEEQLEVGIVLRTAMLQEKDHAESRDGRLEKVRSVADAQRILWNTPE